MYTFSTMVRAVSPQNLKTSSSEMRYVKTLKNTTIAPMVPNTNNMKGYFESILKLGQLCLCFDKRHDIGASRALFVWWFVYVFDILDVKKPSKMFNLYIFAFKTYFDLQALSKRCVGNKLLTFKSARYHSLFWFIYTGDIF